MTIVEKFWQGVKEFNQQQFYACHDTLEAIWIEAPESDKRFYQGVLQVAVGCYHLSNHNWRGAVMLLGEGVRRLSDYQPEYQGIDVELLMEQANQLLQTLQRIEPEQIELFWQQLQNSGASSLERLDFSPPRFARSPQEQNLVVNCKLPQITKVDSSRS